eukprot:TRINITY_DN10771_c0_g1_i1.p1 TRINITY_DN10771_c0_g1~~TRINITY_DN10771_c0_g1_i1.p1  ORF type:complete len:416 (+),score=33.56 TRINITY_DN10771_c0_g1_i1:96-1343(+)
MASTKLLLMLVVLCSALCLVSSNSFSVSRRIKAPELSKRTIPIMTEFGEIFYYISLHVGNPPQHLLVTLDTGSSLIGLPTTTCTGCTQMERYNLTLTTSSIPFECNDISQCYSRTCGATPARCRCQANECQTTTRYSDGSFWNATIVYDDVRIGGYWAHVPIGAISAASANMFRAPSEGIIGMSLSSEWLNALFKQHPEVNPLWSICIGADGGQMTLGNLDANLYRGPIGWTQFVELEKPFYYSVSLENFKIYPRDNPKLAETVLVPSDWNGNGSVLVDTGASHIFVGQEVYDGLRSAMKALCSHGYQWIGFCLLNDKGEGFFESYRYDNLTVEQLDDMPIFELNFSDNVSVQLTWEEYLIERAYADGMRTFFLGFLVASKPEINLGDPFIRSSFLAFDFTNGRMGVAAKTSACD